MSRFSDTHTTYDLCTFCDNLMASVGEYVKYFDDSMLTVKALNDNLTGCST
jgi:hypothetical protein